MRDARNLFFVCCLMTLPLAAAGGDEPLRDEDVVRMLVSGTPVERLIERVRTSPVDFDLSEEMLDELRHAGVPPDLIQAMVERQNELHPVQTEPEPVVAVEEPPTGPRLRVRLNPDWKPAKDRPRPALRVLDAVPQEAAEAMRLRPGEERFTDLAVALLCRTATHVPDHWRNQTPLGRDFNATPRHRLLAFVAGATTSPARKDLSVLELELPERIEVEIETGTVHDLTLGIAVRAGGRYFLVVQDAWDEIVVEGEDRVLGARLSSSKDDPSRLEAVFLKPDGKE